MKGLSSAQKISWLSAITMDSSLRALRVLGAILAITVSVLATTAAGTPATAHIPVLPAAGAAPAATSSAPTPARVAGTPCAATARACVDLSDKRAWLIRDGAVEYGPVPIAHGREGHRTPPGTFRVTFKNRHHVSSIYGIPMPYSVFFNRGIAFHQGNLRGQSYGCILLSREAARTFFDALRPGDVVQVVR